jgi:hypothetical protein
MAKIRRVYGIGQPFENVFPIPLVSSSAPTTSDTGFDLGQVWVRKTTNQAYILTSVASGSASWVLIAPGTSVVDTLTGDGGGAIVPVGGDIDLAGGTNITTAGTAGTITFNLDATVVLATSMSSPIYTVAAATDLAINAIAGQDVIMKLGDAVGANKLSLIDSASAERASIDSDGTLTVVNMDGIIGATTPAAIIGTTIVGNTSVTSGGNMILSAVATQIEMNGGAETDYIGQGTLVTGVDVILNTNIATTDRIIVSRSGLNASPALGFLITTISAGVSFTVTSYGVTGAAANTDVSSFDYVIIKQN